MKILKSVKRIFYLLMVMCLVAFGFMVRAAGYARSARFNIDMLERVLAKYYYTYERYPKELEELSEFYIVSIFDRLYLDSESLKKQPWRGYRYDYQRIGKDQFALSASPVGFWPSRFEYGITEKGILKVNEVAIDPTFDSYTEMEHWRWTARIDMKNEIE